MEAKNEKGNRRMLLIVAGIFIGLGLGGFVDGILLHQIFQWQHMLSSVRPLTTTSSIDTNMVWDGLFHAMDWIFVVIGVVLLWWAGSRKEVPWSANLYFGSILLGAGLFNLVEGIIDHHILGIHHVRSGPNQLVWDLGFLAVGLLLVILGWIMIQKTKNYEL